MTGDENVGLRIERLHCRDFRSYSDFELAGIGGLTVVVGPNAVGKTNLLEGLQLLTALSSFRNPSPSHLIREGASSALFAIDLQGEGRKLSIEFHVKHDAREYRLNGKKKRSRDLRGLLPSVMFSPDDLQLVKGGQSLRRAQADHLGSQLSANYQAVRKDYEKVLRQKNRYLKESVSDLYLQSINDILATVGSQLYQLRCSMLSALEPYLKSSYARISGGNEEVSLAYVPSWLREGIDFSRFPGKCDVSRAEGRSCLLEAMERDSRKERERRMSTQGPHRDAVEFYLDGRCARLFASQGQQRSLVLALKMAEVELIRERLGQAPVLLLDDVMSELDGSRREALLSLISGDIQTFITATNAESLGDLTPLGGRIVRIGGAV